MRKLQLAGATAIGIVLGAVAFNAITAEAQMAVIDVKAIAQEIKNSEIFQAIQAVVTTMNATISDIKTLVSPIGDILKQIGDGTFGTVQQLLQEGFTQNANYAKAQIGAAQQITDASNTAMSLFHRDMRNAQMRDEQAVSPVHCTALDGGVSTQSAAVQAFTVGATIAAIHDQRAEAGPNMPSYYGAGQGVASINQEHVSYYCDQIEASAGLCPGGLSATPDADQQYSSFFGGGTYASQAAVNAAKDYAINLIEPVAPPPLRGDQLTALQGQDAAVRRRSFNARMSLAQTFVDRQIGMQTPSVPLTPQQQQFLTGLGLPPQTTASWLQALQIEAERRISDVGWNASLQSMPPASVEREIAIELALSNYLQFQIFNLALQTGTISAAQLAETTEHNFQPAVRMPTPSMTAGGSTPVMSPPTPSTTTSSGGSSQTATPTSPTTTTNTPDSSQQTTPTVSTMPGS